jgi:hypothetical protein
VFHFNVHTSFCMYDGHFTLIRTGKVLEEARTPKGVEHSALSGYYYDFLMQLMSSMLSCCSGDEMLNHGWEITSPSKSPSLSNSSLLFQIPENRRLYPVP